MLAAIPQIECKKTDGMELRGKIALARVSSVYSWLIASPCNPEELASFFAS